MQCARDKTGHMTGLWFLPARPLRLNTNDDDDDDPLVSLEHSQTNRITVRPKKNTFLYLDTATCFCRFRSLSDHQ